MKPWIAFAITAALAAPFLGTRLAQAEPPQSLTLDTSRLWGIFGGAEVGTGIYGYELSGNLGVQAQELRILDDKSGAPRYVLQWNGGAQGVGGVLANTHPYNAIYGVREQAGGEAGIRLMPSYKLSPYISAALSTDGHAIAVAGSRPLTQLNNTDGLAGTAAALRARLNLGGSVLSKDHLEMVFFVQEEVISKQTDSPGKAFTDIGLHLKYDIKDSLALASDAWIGRTGQTDDASLGTTTQTNRWGFDLNVVKTLSPHWLLGGGIALEREGNTTSNAGSALVFTTAEPLNAIIGLQVGYTP